MAKLTSIDGIQDGQLELLEAAGFVEVRHVADIEASVLHKELEKANKMLSILDEMPGLEEVEAWVTKARGGEPTAEADESEEPEDESDAVENGPVELVNYEADPDVQDMLQKAPLALPIPNRELAARGIPPVEVAIAPVLNRAAGDLDVRVSAHDPYKPAVPDLAPKSKRSGLVKVGSSRSTSRRGIDAGRIRSLDDARSGDTAVQPLTAADPTDEDDRLRLLRTARESTNRGKDPQSKSFVRGVLHDRPMQVWFGCVLVILFQIVVPLSLVSAPLLILSDQKPETFAWVPRWIIAFPVSLPVIGLLCLMISCRVKCRVCGQKVLLPRHCRKNVKAHHVKGLGYVFPLAIHTLVYRWFNCTFCGTSVRIKE